MHLIVGSMQKKERQKKILELIATSEIARQENIAAELSRLGFRVTQASISRDLDELGVEKQNGKYSLPNRPARSAATGIHSLLTAGENLVVAKCDPGLASAIAVRIDSANIDEIVGTVAGDDTIFIAVKDRVSQASAMSKIWTVLLDQ